MFEPAPRKPVALLIVAGISLALVALAVLQMSRSLPPVIATATIAPTSVLGQTPGIPLPAAGGSNVAVTGLGVVGAAGSEAARPIASVTKVMTAYVILKDHPLEGDQEGPAIAITGADRTRYIQMLNQDQSVLPVSAGQSLTQLELLQGLLVPSANNFGEILAVWDSGSVASFVNKMNAQARELGMTNTIYADTSGYSVGTTSTPGDQLILARAAMANPVFARIVAMDSVRLPGIGLVETTNEILGEDGIVGIKTGFTEEAGGNLAFAAKRQAGAGPVEIIGMVFGQPSKTVAFSSTRTVVNAVAQAVQRVKVVSRDQPIATLKTSWGDQIEVVASEDVTMLLWPGMSIQSTVQFEEIRAPADAGTQVGWLELKLGEQQSRVPLVLKNDLDNAGLFWRLKRI
jgi:D-alanyl-D-alanine carboxypeptidase (penicillin-binding protein 5/6)